MTFLLGVKPDDEAHPVLGNAKTALAKLMKQRYLIREKLQGSNNEVRPEPDTYRSLRHVIGFARW
jgi:hypothetical protein